MEHVAEDAASRRRKQPLSLNALAVLVAVAAGRQTGAAIQWQVVADTVGRFVRSSSLYETLHRFEAQGWVKAEGTEYVLTAAGKAQLRRELAMVAALSRAAKTRL